MEWKKHGGTFKVPKHAFIEAVPLPPKHPLYDLLARNLKEECIAKMLGCKICE
ncbi:MAG: hypothetical protein HON53_14040 [Planctomycetaceae bacterium]|nr:hypothetical protein [Planctomycetaceae bacterium]MBT6158126.1 hypothetical protein [Planctomycetaceae bacterium]MBT6483843.1 hypothetical protein [Planctomycetaceae bacterium]MBT6494934.1 hypothetical protein [Planctomycetaceae bacterium]